ncbi:MAG TPA: SOS response-associated peptidase [Planctomycetaceae bacterium]|nr:SOS response-associated peptidase [Planctomycetaceae bacterium]
MGAKIACKVFARFRGRYNGAMCGRYTLRVSPAELADIFSTLRAIEWSARYNIAPTQMVVAIRPAEGASARELATLKWGLIPSWADSPKIGSSLINARADTVATKPAFRSAFKKKRCLIPADGFYEWQAIPGLKTKQPFLIGVRDVPVFAFAGLWEHWTSPEGTRVESCSIITTEANELMQQVHNRMPVILDPADYDRWLDRDSQPQDVLPLLKPFPAERMQLVPVSTLVNSARNERPECVQPLILPSECGGCT